jgi:hypothetical protein
MPEDEYWSIGRKEIICVLGGSGIFAIMSLVMRAAPPWWFLRGRGIDKAAKFAEQGGYEALWLQSLIGWIVVGPVLGLIFSNVILRGKSWD